MHLMTRRLTEVAKKAGVSEATVSRVLNGKHGVSEATRTAVLTALDVLGYERPSKLRGERGRMVGLVLPELQNPIFPAFAEVIAGALAQRGFIPALCGRTIGGVTEAEYVEMLLDHQVSGVIFVGDGVHVGAADLSPAEVRAVVGGGMTLGLSTHTPEQVEAALVEPIDYVAIGPIFTTASKVSEWPVVGTRAIKAAAAIIGGRLPLVAIGGITLERAPEVIAAGATSVAVISDLLRGDPTRRAAEFLRALR
jgi:thiamine-phosphate diphosphorylase